MLKQEEFLMQVNELLLNRISIPLHNELEVVKSPVWLILLLFDHAELKLKKQRFKSIF
jgi:hypothetical protein